MKSVGGGSGGTTGTVGRMTTNITSMEQEFECWHFCKSRMVYWDFSVQ